MSVEPLIEHRITLAGFETRALELEGEGFPHLLLHGFSDSADTWRLVLDRFAREQRRAIALDLPGFGAAGRLAGGPVLPQLDRFADAAIDHVGTDAIVVGNSLGACVAMRLAERAPAAGAAGRPPVAGAEARPPVEGAAGRPPVEGAAGRPRQGSAGGQPAGIVALAPAGLDMSFWIDLIEASPLLAPLLALPSPVSGTVVRAAVGLAYQQLALASPRSVGANVISQFTAHFDGRRTVSEYLGIARRLRGELRDPFELERIRCPLLLVYGERDRLVPPSGAERVLRALPAARLELLDGCGHCPQIEAVDRLLELLADFRQEVSSARFDTDPRRPPGPGRPESRMS